jgi:hypothetical protein
MKTASSIPCSTPKSILKMAIRAIIADMTDFSNRMDIGIHPPEIST